MCRGLRELCSCVKAQLWGRGIGPLASWGCTCQSEFDLTGTPLSLERRHLLVTFAHTCRSDRSPQVQARGPASHFFRKQGSSGKVVAFFCVGKVHGEILRGMRRESTGQAQGEMHRCMQRADSEMYRASTE